MFGRGFETVTTNEPFYPGFFIQYNPKTATERSPRESCWSAPTKWDAISRP